MSSVVTLDQVKQALPRDMRGSVQSSIVDKINEIANADSHMRECYRDNVLGYLHVVKDGKYKMTDYLNAVRFVSYKLMGLGIAESYARTFPDRFQRLKDEGASDKHISSFSSSYNKNKLVNAILEQSLIPSHVLNADVFQKAVNTQMAIMLNDDASYKVRSDAANSLMVHLKQPEKSKVELDVTVNEGKTIDELRDVTRRLAEEQAKVLDTGLYNTKEIAHSKIVEGEVVE
mgnify:CR=1 FL=1